MNNVFYLVWNIFGIVCTIAVIRDIYIECKESRGKK